MIQYSKYARDLLYQGVIKLSNAVGITLGPKGRNVVLFNEEGKAYLTKDGVSVAKKVHSDNCFEDAGIQIVREASLKTAEIAGDGTTSSTVLARRMFTLGINALDNSNITPVELKNGMLNALDTIVGRLVSQTEYIDFDYNKIRYIATTSANNDSNIGNLVSEAFISAGKNGIVTFDMSPNGGTYVEYIEGTQIDNGVYSTDFIYDKKKLETRLSSAYVLLVDGPINSFNDILTVAKYTASQHNPLIIVAEDFGGNTIRKCYSNNYQGFTDIIPIKLSGYISNRKEILSDLSIITGATVVSPSSHTDYQVSCLGMSEKVIATSLNTTFTKNSAVEDSIIQSRVEELKGQIDYAHHKNPEAEPYAKRRLAKFLGKISMIYVGGSTEVEAKERYDRVEDAVCATRAALEEGISAGGGSTFVVIQKELESHPEYTNKGFSLVVDSLSAPFEQLCTNAGIDRFAIINSITKDIGYNFLTDKLENLKISGIIDPTKVLIVELENAVSVVSMLLTTECIVSDD